MEKQEESKKVVSPTGDLYRIWNDLIPLPINTKVFGKREGLQYAYGSRLFTKMVLFLEQNMFTQEDYRFYMDKGPARETTEEYEAYKVRRKFQKALFKYRYTIKQVTFLNTITKLKEEQTNGKKK